MITAFVISSLSMFFWIFPAVKQYKTELFWYFLVLAFADPITMIVWALIRSVTEQTQVIFNFLLLLSVLWSFKNKKSIRILIAVVLSSVILSFFFGRIFRSNLALASHVIVTYFFIKRTFIFVANNGKVNIFHLFLLLEEISIILKRAAMLISLNPGSIYFYATTAFEILIAIFFTLYREDNTKLHIDLRNA